MRGLSDSSLPLEPAGAKSTETYYTISERMYNIRIVPLAKKVSRLRRTSEAGLRETQPRSETSWVPVFVSVWAVTQASATIHLAAGWRTLRASRVESGFRPEARSRGVTGRSLTLTFHPLSETACDQQS